MDFEERRVTALVAHIVQEKDLAQTSRLWHDLRIGGDDAWELIEGIAHELKVDFAGFDFDRYFPPETGALAEMWWWRLSRRTTRAPLTIGHLVTVARARRWRDPA